MRLIALALLSSLMLVGCTQEPKLPPLTKFAVQKSDEAQPPLEFQIELLSNLADPNSPQWQSPHSYLASNPILVRITNRSSKDVVLPDAAELESSFYCSSTEARERPSFNEAFMRTIVPVLLHPQESFVTHDWGLKGSIAFLRPGNYHVEYQFAIGYAYVDHPIPGKEKENFFYRYRADHLAVATGSFDVLIHPNQVYRDESPH